ncbi:MAG: flagellar transcriptional regulator FlhD, partial [Burkholderiales bacterium]
MKFEQMMEEIREANLTYLLLAQQMLRDDREAAMFRLGLDGDVADIMAGLSPAQVVKMASSNMLLCRFRFDDRVIFSMLSGYAKDRALPQHRAELGEDLALHRLVLGRRLDGEVDLGESVDLGRR